ncbi:ParB family chromosome partitioning protein OS=Castellaniella defragrans OX=75697 GN=HNR28_003268 PE=4 SV=1 [Castellaniella defragrans]
MTTNMPTTGRTEILPKHLILSGRYQARKKPGQQPLAELAESIAAQGGLLQNLVAVKGKKRGEYEVVAGGRRWAAIQLLMQDSRWPEDQPVPVLIVPGTRGLEASLAENTMREDMHPADEFEAFAALIDQGGTIEDVAARFGKQPNYVRGRMKLAHVAPELLQAYRDDEMSLSVVMAFAITDDQDRQREQWVRMDRWDRKNAQPSGIRQCLMDEAWTADHALAKYVGLDAYEAAGGRMTRDLFAADGDLRSIYLHDPDILKGLAADKMQADLARLGEGWAWIEAALSFEEAGWNGYSNKYGRVYAQSRKLTKDEAAQIKALTKRIDALDHDMDVLADSDEDDGDAWDQMNEELEALKAQRAALNDAAKVWSDEAKKIAGVGVYIDHSGALNVTYGLIRPEDRHAVQAAAQAAAGAGDDATALRTSLPAPTTRPAYSERLMRQLTANKVGAVAADLAGKPAIALAVLVAQLAQEKLGPGWAQGFGLGVSLRGEALDTHAPDYAESKAAKVMDGMRQHWLNVLPTDEGRVTPGILAWTLAQDQQTLVDLLAFCIAGTVQGIQHHETDQATPLDVLAATAGTDIVQWWEPTGPSFLQHVSKGMIAQAVIEGAGADAALPLAAMKKGAAVDAATHALAGKRWVPQPMRIRPQHLP